MNSIDEEGDCNTGSTPALTFTEFLKTYPSARDKLLEMVPELVKDIQTKISWKNSDPRDTFTYNHDINIIILRPTITGDGVVAGTGQVNTKQVYSIFTSFEDYKLIDANQKWDPTWKWIKE